MDRYARPSCRRPSSSSASPRRSTPSTVTSRPSPGSTSTCRPARSSPCSGRAAAARRRCCAWSAASTSRPPARSPSTGRTPHDARAAKRVGFVPQSPGLLPWRTVAANARLLLDVNRRVAVRQAPDPLDLLADVGLADFAGAYPHELSGGMQQRVSLVRAMALGAPLLLMDEPFAALDEITRADMRHLLARLCEQLATTVLFVTHSIAEAVFISDRVAVLSARPGRIVGVESIDLAHPRHPDLEDDPAFFAHETRLRALLHEGSWSVSTRRIVLAALTGIAVFGALWELFVWVFDVRPFVLLPPSQIVEELADRPSFYLEAAAVTARQAAAGIAISLVVAVLTRRAAGDVAVPRAGRPAGPDRRARRPVGRLLHVDRAVARQWRPARHLPRRLRDHPGVRLRRRRRDALGRPGRSRAAGLRRRQPGRGAVAAAPAVRAARHPRRRPLQRRPGARRGVLRRGRQPDDGRPRRRRPTGDGAERRGAVGDDPRHRRPRRRVPRRDHRHRAGRLALARVATGEGSTR